jgi:hypothetical protein
MRDNGLYRSGFAVAVAASPGLLVRLAWAPNVFAKRGMAIRWR